MPPSSGPVTLDRARPTDKAGVSGRADPAHGQTSVPNNAAGRGGSDSGGRLRRSSYPRRLGLIMTGVRRAESTHSTSNSDSTPLSIASSGFGTAKSSVRSAWATCTATTAGCRAPDDPVTSDPWRGGYSPRTRGCPRSPTWPGPTSVRSPTLRGSRLLEVGATLDPRAAKVSNPITRRPSGRAKPFRGWYNSLTKNGCCTHPREWR